MCIANLADLLCVHHGEGSAENGKVLAEDVDRFAVDRPVAGDDGVARVLLLVGQEQNVEKRS